MNAWLSFQQTSSSYNTLHETVCSHHQSTFLRNHFQGQRESHQSRRCNAVPHTGYNIPHDTCSHCKHPIFQTGLCQGKQSAENNNVHILDPCFSCSTLNGMPEKQMAQKLSLYKYLTIFAATMGVQSNGLRT